MPYRYTFQDAIDSTAFQDVAGVSTSGAEFKSLLNEAQRRLLKRGSWYDTEQVMSFCLTGCYITWPRFVGTVIGIRFCGRIGNIVNNHWSFNQGSLGYHHHADFRSNVIVEDAGTAPCYNDISQSAAGATGKLIRYYVVNNQDYGKTLTLYGRQFGAQPLQELLNGATVNGLTLTAANPFATAANYVTKIDSIVRQPTVGMGYLYEYDPVANTMRDLAAFEPGETHPRYRRSLIKNIEQANVKPDSNGVKWTNIEALVKLEFIPVKTPRDFLMIDDLDALVFMIQAIKYEKAGDTVNAELCIKKAIRELNFDLQNKLPDATTVVRVKAVTGRRIFNPI